jgi:biotin operon repressor
VSMLYWTLPKRNAKNYNKHAILDLIRFSQAGISRVELARELGLTRAAVTTIVGDLQKAGLVSELEDRRGGRRPVILEIPASKGYVMGIDMGATHVGLILADLSAHVIREVEHPFDINQGPQICLEQVNDYLKDLLKLADVPMPNVLAAGIGAPGPIIAEKGMVGTPPIMPGWDGFPIRDM